MPVMTRPQFAGLLGKKPAVKARKPMTMSTKVDEEPPPPPEPGKSTQVDDDTAVADSVPMASLRRRPRGRGVV